MEPSLTRRSFPHCPVARRSSKELITPRFGFDSQRGNLVIPMVKTVQTTLLCPECGEKVSIFRRSAKQKKDGHIKHMYCPYCKKTQGFVESRKSEKEQFWENWQNDNKNKM
ncbi:ribosome associated inhibitor A; zinc finger domain [Listeria phage A511]|uniref:Gp58 n=9 Tax=Pecentumvirus TaxID=1857844 RepID=A8AT82_BPA51|nr:ribosome associated inhibitor A; zinc finger domain [Listeria phage A511]AAY53029.1 gp58 [Listeria phage A511]